jgi:hypothetical protein
MWESESHYATKDGRMRALSVGWGFSKSSPEWRVVAPFAQGSSGIAPSSL